MGKKRVIPAGSRFGNFFCITEKVDGKDIFRIRRRVTLPCGTKIEPRYPAKNYKNLVFKSDFDQLVNKLNYREDQQAKRNIEIRSSFIPTQIMESFRERLQVDIPSEKDFRYLYNTVFKKYFLNFFFNQNIYDPKDFLQYQEQWAKALLGKADDPTKNVFTNASVKSIKRTIEVANRFMVHLREKDLESYPTLIVFTPISKGALKEHGASLGLNEEDETVGQFITDTDWEVINDKLPESIGAFVRLAYFYGLRRAETLGFDSPTSVKNGYLRISKQLKSFKNGNPAFKTLKDKDSRSTPHWFTDVQTARELVVKSMAGKMHPDTLYTKWVALMKSLNMSYDLHDLRRTFISRALIDRSPRLVQLSVGHVSISTTMLYGRDHRNLSDEVYDPEAANKALSVK